MWSDPVRKPTQKSECLRFTFHGWLSEKELSNRQAHRKDKRKDITFQQWEEKKEISVTR